MPYTPYIHLEVHTHAKPTLRIAGRVYGRVHVHDTRKRGKMKKRQIRPRLHGAWITFEPGQARPSFPSVSRAFRSPADIGQPEGHLFFYPAHHSAYVGAETTAMISWMSARGAGVIRREARGSRQSIRPANCTRRVACRNATALARGIRKVRRALSPSRRRRRRCVSTAPDTVRHYREMFANTVRLNKSARVVWRRSVWSSSVIVVATYSRDISAFIRTDGNLSHATFLLLSSIMSPNGGRVGHLFAVLQFAKEERWERKILSTLHAITKLVVYVPLLLPTFRIKICARVIITLSNAYIDHQLWSSQNESRVDWSIDKAP